MDKNLRSEIYFCASEALKIMVFSKIRKINPRNKKNKEIYKTFLKIFHINDTMIFSIIEKEFNHYLSLSEEKRKNFGDETFFLTSENALKFGNLLYEVTHQERSLKDKEMLESCPAYMFYKEFSECVQLGELQHEKLMQLKTKYLFKDKEEERKKGWKYFEINRKKYCKKYPTEERVSQDINAWISAYLFGRLDANESCFYSGKEIEHLYHLYSWLEFSAMPKLYYRISKKDLLNTFVYIDTYIKQHITPEQDAILQKSRLYRRIRALTPIVLDGSYTYEKLKEIATQ